MALSIVYEDDYIICVNKPNNVLIHHAFLSRNVADEDSLLQLIQKDFDLKVNFLHPHGLNLSCVT